MPIHVNDSDTWKEVDTGWVNDNGTWKKIDTGWVNDSSTWKKCYSRSGMSDETFLVRPYDAQKMDPIIGDMGFASGAAWKVFEDDTMTDYGIRIYEKDTDNLVYEDQIGEWDNAYHFSYTKSYLNTAYNSQTIWYHPWYHFIPETIGTDSNNTISESWNWIFRFPYSHYKDMEEMVIKVYDKSDGTEVWSYSYVPDDVLLESESVTNNYSWQWTVTHPTLDLVDDPFEAINVKVYKKGSDEVVWEEEYTSYDEEYEI